jgi:hypothetical protein
MKHLRTFENKIDSDSIKALESFYKSFEDYKSRSYNIKDVISVAKNYKIPEALFDEFILLKFYYESRSGQYTIFTSNTDKENNYIKKEIKKTALKSIIKKIDDDVDVYLELKDALDKRPRYFDGGSFDYIRIGSVKNIFFLLHNAIKKAPLSQDIIKYNL